MGFEAFIGVTVVLRYQEAKGGGTTLLLPFLLPFPSPTEELAKPTICYRLAALSPQMSGFSLRKTNLILKLSKPGKKCSDGKFFPERSSTEFNHLKENMAQGWQREAGHVTRRATGPAAPALASQAGCSLPGCGFP